MSFSEVYRRLQQTAVRRSGIFNENARRSAHIARRSTIPARELFANDWEGAVVTYFSPHSNPLEISCLSFEAISSFWIESRTGEDVGQQLSADTINKAASSFRKRLREYMKCDHSGEGHFDHWFWLKKLYTQCLYTVSLVDTILDNVKLSSYKDEKQGNFVSSVGNAIKLFRFATKLIGSRCVKFYVIALCDLWKLINALGGYSKWAPRVRPSKSLETRIDRYQWVSICEPQ